jgi:hypothetical protein
VAEIANLPSERVTNFRIAVRKTVQRVRPKGGQSALSEIMAQERFA